MRRKAASKRLTLTDQRFNDEIIYRLINAVMIDGKKSVATKVVYDAMDIVGEKSEESALDVFHKAMTNISPVVEVRGKRVGGATYQIPMEVRAERRVALALRWLKKYSESRSGKSMATRLAAEILDASNSQGSAVKKREEVHKMAEANKAFSHFRF
ncbi:ribosomal protein S7 [Chloroherpeton thalassium ATCC 35110]|uniref:Small ribosomal subunit protein uS7 n=1 Tax=Chloroherpeton thalassium (strain ATCC 35110 / GB-78) TaxID=517418 RepID=RS7_CHLT3|nr:30S ribosomal protein S7 [Chloroherpeton thalassium]B3QY20.1 RecName: Full=Small ribosomal subunit protein uS7; AltName: Full=30S ribosomal protein S7 [Chloroherpeton thalassium ATCC 35110]ACF13548.1 ribosomal protein S7 [Chloroherpeton thalassium ATCC 35110]